MEERDVIRVIIDFLSKQFPKDCNCCGKHYHSLADFIKNTKHLGQPVSYDADEKDWFPKIPIGTISIYTCSCGTSLSLGSDGMNVMTLWRIMQWARKESKARGTTISDVLEDLRDKIDNSVLQDEDV